MTRRLRALACAALAAALFFGGASAEAQTSFSGRASSGGGTPGGSSGQVQYNNAGSFGGFTQSGDCTTDTATGTITCAALGSVAPGGFYSKNVPAASDFIGSDGTDPIGRNFGVGLTSTGSLTAVVNDQTAGNYAVLTGDSNKTVLVNAGSHTLAQAGAVGFASGWGACLLNVGATAATLTTTTSVFKGASEATSLSIPTKGWACFDSNGTNYNTVVGAYGTALLNVEGQTLAGGANVTAKTQTTGNLTVNCGERPLQHITNGGAWTLTAPAADGSCMLLVTNNASAGTITFSGFSVGSNTGDTLTTTNTSKFTLSVWRINGTSGYRVAAHQ